MDINKIETHLKSLWKPRISEETGKITFKRSTTLIVPEMGWDKKLGKGSLNIEHWAYELDYAFRVALDLSYDTRRRKETVIDKETGQPVIDSKTGKKKTVSRPYQIWTQGFKIHFKEGDLLRSKKGHPAIQVQSSTPMYWDDEKNEMSQGIVNYEHFDQVKFGHTGDVKTVSQMDFLKIIINGNSVDGKKI